MNYENLLKEYEDEVKIKEHPLKYNLKGLYMDGKIVIDSKMNDTEKVCVLAEEIGHHYTSHGNIIDQDNINNRKQEISARRWGYNKLVGIIDIVNAFNKGINTKHDLAEYLNVTEEFLSETICYYRCKYGIYYYIDEYCIIFEPTLRIIKLY